MIKNYVEIDKTDFLKMIGKERFTGFFNILKRERLKFERQYGSSSERSTFVYFEDDAALVVSTIITSDYYDEMNRINVEFDLSSERD